jgi:lysyl-tRNA synthetase class 2
MTELWRPSASINVLQERAAIIDQIRAFFKARNVLEVETPSLSAHTITDPYLEAMQTLHTLPGANQSRTLYLQTSPEYAMKRLLAAGSGDIFQISKAFRDDEVGRLHNPEFTMLEWYRTGFSMQHLIDEVKALLMSILALGKIEQSSYCDIFKTHLGIDPLCATLGELKALCSEHSLNDYVDSLQAHLHQQQDAQTVSLLKDSILQVLFSTCIEPSIGQDYPIVITNFPASQASLATLNEDNKTANRFEVYFQGIELANGFDELTDVNSQRQRFETDNQKRKMLGLVQKPIDTHFIEALENTFPQCAGVALGIDRLIMLALNKNSIEEVMSFNHRNC